MKKIKALILTFLTIGILCFPTYSMADVGDFESYDSDWGYDSSWDSDWGSDWDSSYDYGYDYGYYDDGSGLGSFGMIFIIAIIIIISLVGKSKGKIIRDTNYNYPNVSRPVKNYSVSKYVRNPQKSEMVADSVRKADKYFNDEQFLAWVKNLFVKLQTAWSERDWETIRPLESEALFEQHSKQLNGYIKRKQINKMERICVNYAELVTFAQDNEKDILVVALNSSMTDYIVDEVSGKILKGSKDYRLTNTYKLTFIRKKGIVTEEGTDTVKTTNCPNCGAPTTITSSGKCEFCGAVITIGAHDWVLGDMERF